MDEEVLADGERVVRRYPCTAVDRVAYIAGTVIPLPGGVESEGVLTLTNRRVIFDLESNGRGRASQRQEVALSSVSSVSSMMSKFGRDLRLPIALAVIGFLMMFAPFVALYEAGAFEDGPDYVQGYNDGVEFGYLETYLRAVQSGQVSHGIPDGYDFYPQQSPTSEDYARGYYEGWSLGVQRASQDVLADAEFSAPEDLMLDGPPSAACIASAAAGAVVLAMGAVLHMLSNTTKDWIAVRLGASGRGVAVKSFNGGWRATGDRALTAEDQYWAMTRELGAAILDVRGYREHRLRVVDDDVYISDGDDEEKEEEPAEDRGHLEPVPDFDEYEDLDGCTDELIVVDDDDDRPRIVGPWGD